MTEWKPTVLEADFGDGWTASVWLITPGMQWTWDVALNGRPRITRSERLDDPKDAMLRAAAYIEANR